MAAQYLLLLAPSANRVFAEATPALAKAELAVTTGIQAELTWLDQVGALAFSADDLDLAALARQSCALVAFERRDEWLKPLALPNWRVFPDDLVTIPKYRGKTNELFTQMLVHLTLSQVETAAANRGERLDILDPMAGRGTTLTTAWLNGFNGYGVEQDQKAIASLETFIKTYLRRGRYKHKASLTPIRRDGRKLGTRLDIQASVGDEQVSMVVMSGDTRDSKMLYGKKTFDAIITDAPYGVRHSSSDKGQRSRSAKELLTQAIPIWASQLRSGGALGISWNTYSMSRPDLEKVIKDAGFKLTQDPSWGDFAHRVDSSINRDLLVARA